MTKSRHVPRDVWNENIKKGLAARSPEAKALQAKRLSESHKGKSWGHHTAKHKRMMSKRYTGIKRAPYNMTVGATDNQKEISALRSEYSKWRHPEMPYNPQLTKDELKILIEHLKKLPR